MSGLVRTCSATTLAAIMLLSWTSNTLAWGGTNLNQTPGETDKVCVRDMNTSTAENCDVYISPATDYTLFNRFIDRPLEPTNPDSSLIDERDFVQICEVDPNVDKCVNEYVDHINIESGKQYQVYTMYHNNAAPLENGDPNPIHSSHAATMSAAIPDNIKMGEETKIASLISWDTPGQAGTTSSVWDEAFVTSASDVYLQYVSESAKIHMNELDATNSVMGVAEKVMSPSLFAKEGTFIGHYDTNAKEITLDGVTYGSPKYSGWVTYRFEVKPVACPTNPDLSIDDPQCNSQGIEPCQWDENLSANDPKCVPPAEADSDISPTMIVIIIAGLVVISVIAIRIFRR